MVIRRVGALSCAKVTGLLYVILGLVFGACISLVSILGLIPEGAGMFFGAGAIVVLPIVYGLFGFIGALIMTSLFNLAVGITGGIEVDAS